jgi:glycoprotein endo-alpha-1,2-mannosidase
VRRLLPPASVVALAALWFLAGCDQAGSRAESRARAHAAGPVIPDPRVHAFYYPWYGTPARDGAYVHWSHDQLGDVPDRVTYPGGDDIGADFYPAGGCYSSHDPEVLARHMRQLRRAGVGSLCVSWWGDGSFEDRALPALLDAAAEGGIAVSFHLEPLPGRDAAVSRAALASLLGRFGDHAALWRDAAGRPLVFVYDSYLSTPDEWARLLTPGGDLTIRGAGLDCVMIGLWVERGHGEDLARAGFDGAYTYFATDGFTYGSTIANWPAMAAFCAERGLLFAPCVGPGYADLRIRPWNTANQRGREGGDYYRRMADAAVALAPPLVGMTSFNEWHEGTQIEPAQPMAAGGFTYRDYGDVEPEGYLDLTRKWVLRYASAAPAAD